MVGRIVIGIFVCLIILVGAIVGYIYRDLTLPTNLIICFDTPPDAVEIARVDSLNGTKIYETLRKDVRYTDMIRFSSIKKGYWRIFFEHDSHQEEHATLLADGIESWINCPESVHH